MNATIYNRAKAISIEHANAPLAAFDKTPREVINARREVWQAKLNLDNIRRDAIHQKRLLEMAVRDYEAVIAGV